MRTTVVLGQWLDRPVEADVDVALLADRLGYPELWIPEMAKVDAPAFAAAIAERTGRIELTLGPLAVTVRSAVQIAIAASTVAAMGRTVNVALGTSSNVVARWHGRSRAGAAEQLAVTRHDLAELFAGKRVNGYRLPQVPDRPPSITVAAFGPRAVDAARSADRMVLNMVTVDAAGRLAAHHSHTAIWLCAALDPTDDERAWLTKGLVGYVAAPGYGEMFTEAGYGDLVEFARTRPGPKEIFARMPRALLDDVGLVGSQSTIRTRLRAYEDAGIDEVCIVPPPVGSACGQRTLEALAPGRG